MKYSIATIAAFALTIGVAAANDEFLASCQAYKEAFSSSVDCDCLNKAAMANPALYDEFAKVQKPEDVSLLSEEARKVLAGCSEPAAE